MLIQYILYTEFVYVKVYVCFGDKLIFFGNNGNKYLLGRIEETLALCRPVDCFHFCWHLQGEPRLFTFIIV